jgi:hypothetical protein
MGIVWYLSIKNVQNVVLLTILHVNKTTKYSFQVIMELLSTEKSDLDVPVIII